ncbi:MAG: hypothetical protein JWL99_4890 [Streptomyces oryziradicis]|nr:hypothetical protein [Actinacidiphila oryziradicis]
MGGPVSTEGTKGTEGSGGTPAEIPRGPRVGALARDIGRDKVGVVMAILGDRIFLRPLGGGREWETAMDGVRALRPREELSVRLAVANARSRNPIR